jgi:hypothetical protein
VWNNFGCAPVLFKPDKKPETFFSAWLLPSNGVRWGIRFSLVRRVGVSVAGPQPVYSIFTGGRAFFFTCRESR